MAFLVTIIHYISLALVILLIADVVLSYFTSPYQPIRQAVGRIVNPILNPIRRILPSTGAIDFSPLVAIILIQIIEYVLTRLILSFSG